VHHRYDDKYSLAEFMVSAAMASQVTCLVELGLTEETLNRLVGWAEMKEVTLEFRASEKCTFNRQTKRDVEGAVKAKVGFLTSKVVTTIQEWFWDVEMEYKLVAYSGTG
jgi:hypothetical protein